MGGLPKKKVSASRRGQRRSHDRIKVPQLSTCPQCRNLKPTHRVCLVCGTYNGRQVLQVKVKRAREQ
jgi:large subunit ribosomal protein L32